MALQCLLVSGVVCPQCNVYILKILLFLEDCLHYPAWEIRDAKLCILIQSHRIPAPEPHVKKEGEKTVLKKLKIR